MKVLLDENLPKRLKADLSMFEVSTVREKDWQGRENGELIRAMLAESYQALLTFDKNLQYQQNFAKYPVTVLLLNAKDNQYATLRPLISKVVEKLTANPKAGVIEIRPD
jgi:predicted nuclease of predicted toxin-antitoxin system